MKKYTLDELIEFLENRRGDMIQLMNRADSKTFKELEVFANKYFAVKEQLELLKRTKDNV